MRIRPLAVCVLVLLPCAIEAQPLTWDWVGRALKEAEETGALCASNPSHDRCNDARASDVLVWCESDTPFDRGRCHGAVEAYASRGAQLQEWQCVPPPVLKDGEQLRRLFVRAGQRTPEILHLPAPQLLYYAVANAFPCRFELDKQQPR
jgi:Rap1a immunity proteins